MTEEQQAAVIARFVGGERPIAIARSTGISADLIIALWKSWAPTSL